MWRLQSGRGGGKYWLWVNIKSEIACDQIFRSPLPQNHPGFFILVTHARSLNYLESRFLIDSPSCRPWSIPCKPFFLLSFGMLRNMPQYIRVVMQKHHLGTHGHRTLYNWNWTQKPDQDENILQSGMERNCSICCLFIHKLIPFHEWFGLTNSPRVEFSSPKDLVWVISQVQT